MTSSDHPGRFVSRAGEKLDHAIGCLEIDPTGWVCADLGSNTGGFVDCLLQRGAERVYAVERGYGVVDYRLRSNPKVVVKERTDAMHVHLPERVRLVTIDTGWTRQRNILPAARRLLSPDGEIITLVKSHYEAEESMLEGGVLPDEAIPGVLDGVRTEINDLGFAIAAEVESPILGRAGNREFLWWLRP